MTKAQKNYPATKGELAAAIIGVKKFKYFLQGGTPFILRTDHKAGKKMEHPDTNSAAMDGTAIPIQLHADVQEGIAARKRRQPQQEARAA